ncbi:unnamed protein product [Rotaria magnacalcarata]|uniref:Uncharacterized protein n=2 Tax=Rotaria magnacalcarata TaxID=392030 RepID=A0A814M4Z8_9BILA|nr:unnamed protein product [Rotaria magnacalcarata]CAF1640695.1 unnamed protein product [Rotaria magnacalcarata]CAF1937003.1 unnamed protein product [Rotaria magnacalcarata]CAF2100103.1 unnamed protein product [Rotaria magnacalcarata]
MLALILITTTQIILANPIDNDILSTTSDLSFEPMNDTVSIDYILSSQSSEDTLTTNSTVESESYDDVSTTSPTFVSELHRNIRTANLTSESESSEDIDTTSSIAASQSVNNTRTIGDTYDQATDVSVLPPPSKNFPLLPLMIVGCALIGLVGVLVGITIVRRKNESAKSATST